MIFKTKTYTERISLPEALRAKFPEPLMYYLRDTREKSGFLFTFVILDLARGMVRYIHSQYPENIALAEGAADQGFQALRFSNPHSAIYDAHHDVITVFTDRMNYYFQLDLKNDTLSVHLESEFPVINARVDDIGSTCFKESDTAEHVYLSASGPDERTGNRVVHYLRASLDFSRAESIYAVPSSPYGRASHVTRKYKHYILCSEFHNIGRKDPSSGQILETTRDMGLFVFKDLFKKYCAERGLPYSDALFDTHVQFAPTGEITFSDSFKAYWTPLGKSWLEIADKHYRFDRLPGRISLLNLENGAWKEYETTSSPAAHIDIDEADDAVYVSSHNFIRTTQRMQYFGPAAIDKFKIENDALVRTGTFTSPTGFRFTTHRAFRYQGRPYVCTVGHPNRLFFIDGETMREAYHADLHQDILSDKADVQDFLNTTTAGTSTPLTFEVSADGEYLVIFGKTHLFFYSFPERRLVAEMPAFPEHPFPDGTSLANFALITIHPSVLR